MYMQLKKKLFDKQLPGEIILRWHTLLENQEEKFTDYS